MVGLGRVIVSDVAAAIDFVEALWRSGFLSSVFESRVGFKGVFGRH